MENFKEKLKSNIVLLSQFLSALVFALVLIPRFIIAIEPKIEKSYVTFDHPVTLSILPAKGTYSKGDIISVQATVHVGDKPINAVGVELLFPEDNVEVVNIDTEGSFCTLFPEKSVDNDAGVIKYSCGLPSPGYSDPYGFVGTFYLKFIQEGYVNLTLGENSQVLADDGFGTNILNKMEGAGYNVVDLEIVEVETEIITTSPLPEPTTEEEEEILNESLLTPIKVNSSTHSDQLKWYASRDVKLEWERTAEGMLYSYALDEDPNTQPDPTLLSSETTAEYSDLSDGVWYFHIMQNTAKKTGPVTHFKVQIDSDIPKNLKVVRAYMTENENEWELELSAEDNIGILYYEIELENGVSVKVQDKPKIQLENKYKNKIIISAYDFAGNNTSINYEIPTREDETFWDKIIYVLYSIFDFFMSL